MLGLLRRLIGVGSKGEAVPPPFTLDLPDGWVGGYGPLPYLEALVKYARAHPECHDRVFELIDASKGIEGLYLASAACGPIAELGVDAVDLGVDAVDGRALSIEEALDDNVSGQMWALASRHDLLGDPTASTVDGEYPGRLVRWSWSREGPGSSFSYTFGYAERLWFLDFVASAEVNEAAFQAIASSFRVTERAPTQ